MDFARLKQLLREAPEPSDPFDTGDPGVLYLREHVLLPTLRGEAVLLEGLDLEAFSPDDVRYIQALWDAYGTWLEHGLQNLQTLYRELKNAAPMAAPAVFL